MAQKAVQELTVIPKTELQPSPKDELAAIITKKTQRKSAMEQKKEVKDIKERIGSLALKLAETEFNLKKKDLLELSDEHKEALFYAIHDKCCGIKNLFLKDKDVKITAGLITASAVFGCGMILSFNPPGHVGYFLSFITCLSGALITGYFGTMKCFDLFEKGGYLGQKIRFRRLFNKLRTDPRQGTGPETEEVAEKGFEKELIESLQQATN